MSPCAWTSRPSRSPTATRSARAGDLAHRADAARFVGAYHDLAQGLNDTLAAVAGPLQASSAALQLVAARDLSARAREAIPFGDETLSEF